MLIHLTGIGLVVLLYRVYTKFSCKLFSLHIKVVFTAAQHANIFLHTFLRAAVD